MGISNRVTTNAAYLIAQFGLFPVHYIIYNNRKKVVSAAR